MSEPAPMAEGTPIVAVRDLVKEFDRGRGEEPLRAVDGVSFTVARGETLGLVGESGSGKSTVARCRLRLTPADGGESTFDGHDMRTTRDAELRRIRGKMQAVFQDPHGSLNRSHRVGDILQAPLAAHGIGDRKSRRARAAELLEMVGLGPAMLDRRPVELSGGQAQRVAIGRALALSPKLIVLDEAVSALDVSVRAQILNLLRDLQRDLELTYLFISHDLAVIRYMSHTVSVMRGGVIVEQGSRERLFANPRHEYTRSLMEAVPVADPPFERERIRAALAQAAG
jgi:peptide/nickel transport system ATP-binding protein